MPWRVIWKNVENFGDVDQKLEESLAWVKKYSNSSLKNEPRKAKKQIFLN